MSYSDHVVNALRKEQEARKYGVYQNEIYFKGELHPVMIDKYRKLKLQQEWYKTSGRL
jgi:hypothetical protein